MEVVCNEFRLNLKRNLFFELISHRSVKQMKEVRHEIVPEQPLHLRRKAYLTHNYLGQKLPQHRHPVRSILEDYRNQANPGVVDLLEPRWRFS